VLVTALAVAMTIQAIRISRERDRANEEAETAKRVSGFLEGLFKVNDPSEARGMSITAREILDAGAQKIETDLKGQEAVQARLMVTMGTVYQDLGLPKKAEPLLRSAVDKRLRLFGPNSIETAESLSRLGWLIDPYGSRSEALELQTRAITTAGSLLKPDDQRLAWIRYRYAVALCLMGRLDQAKPQYERALAVFRDPRHEDVFGQIWCLNDLGLMAGSIGDNSGELEYQGQALAIRRSKLLPNDPDLANGLNNMAATLTHVGHLDQARHLAEEAVALSERVNGPEHVGTGVFLSTLSEIQRLEGDLEGADRTTARALAICEKYLGPSNTNVSEVLLTRAQVERDLGRLTDSELTFQRLFKILEDTSREGGPARLIAALREYDVLLKKLRRSQAASEIEARIRALDAGKSQTP
jgi:tetratricopeptide (TPR) repeat protein